MHATSQWRQAVLSISATRALTHPRAVTCIHNCIKGDYIFRSKWSNCFQRFREFSFSSSCAEWYWTLDKWVAVLGKFKHTGTWASGSTAPLIRILGTRLEEVVNSTHQRFTLENRKVFWPFPEETGVDEVGSARGIFGALKRNYFDENFTNFPVIISKFSLNVICTLGIATFKEWVCGHSLAGIEGSNYVNVMNLSLVSVVCCHLEVSALDQ
jgi:hypothetical protein